MVGGPAPHPVVGAVTGADPNPTARIPYLLYRSGAAVALALPGPVAGAAARAVTRALVLTQPDRRRLVTRHMRRVCGPDASPSQLRRLVRGVFESYGRYWVELFRLPAETPASIEAGMRVDGLEHLEVAFAEGRGVILAVPHLGGWDWGGAWLAVRGFKPVAVAEALQPEALFRWFVEVRERLGMEIVRADREAGTAVLRAVRSGRTVTLVADRDILGSGVEVEFFGERTTLPAGPATLALRTGAPLLPAAVYFEGRGGHRGVVRPPLAVERTGRLRDDVARVTQALAGELETLIRRAPEQWHLLQPNWPRDREEP